MKKKSVKKQQTPRKSSAPRIFLALVVLLCLFFGYMHLLSRVTHLSLSTVYLPDLPPAMEDTTLLFVSDFKLKSPSDAAHASALMDRLALLKPDILILGGDYCANGVLETLNGVSDDALPAYTADFIASLADFHASMGKFAVSGDSDGDLQALTAAFLSAGVSCLGDSSAQIAPGMHIAGLTDRSLNRNGSAKLSQHFRRGDCVIAAAHNPAAYRDIRVQEAEGGGPWADLVLSGHTLGGQINIFGRTLKSFTEEEKAVMAGWFYPNDLPLLVSQGLGCDGIGLRLGSRSEVHLITLKRQTIAH